MCATSSLDAMVYLLLISWHHFLSLMIIVLHFIEFLYKKNFSSSRHRSCLMHHDDDGHWQWYRNPWVSVSIDANFRLYRSKGFALPDFWKGDDEVGEVFFDVLIRDFLRSKCSFDFTTSS
jgi:hypothetical protein